MKTSFNSRHRLGLLTALLLGWPLPTWANPPQLPDARDQAAILAMSGCFEVSFDFVETFRSTPDPAYTPSPPYSAHGLEWVEAVEKRPDFVMLQHLLVVPGSKGPQVIKHWRQDWLYQNTALHLYDGDLRWRFQQLSPETVEGQWTQQVFQVDDGPRYQGSATWVHVDGTSYWENTTPAPLPRREITIRSDYNVLLRRNRHQITPEGWQLEEDNRKMLRRPGQPDQVLAAEKGLTIYRRVDTARCQPARQWWATHQGFWRTVRAVWQPLLAAPTELRLRGKVEEQPLYEGLFAMPLTSSKQAIQALIARYLVTP